MFKIRELKLSMASFTIRFNREFVGTIVGYEEPFCLVLLFGLLVQFNRIYSRFITNIPINFEVRGMRNCGCFENMSIC